MAAAREVVVQSFPEYVTAFSSLTPSAGGSLWFRGIGKTKYELLPSLYRHKTKTSIDALATLERRLMTRFRQRSIPFHSRSLSDDWEALFFMQHYGVPTRLLDWTENPFIGLYFAAADATSSLISGKIQFQDDAAVWILDPIKWNCHALRHQSLVVS